MTALEKTATGLRTFASDIADGFFEITHNGPYVGWVLFRAVTLTARPDLRQAGETKLMGWLQDRHTLSVGMTVEPAG